MRIGSHEYANEADDDDVPKPAQSLDTLVLRQKKTKWLSTEKMILYITQS